MVSAAALAVVFLLSAHSGAQAGEAEAKGLLKAMSDYLAAQNNISFAFDTNFEVVTKEDQKLLLASSGTINLSRPDKIHATRSGGFANVELMFDGKTLTLLGKDADLYAQAEVPGTVENLIDELRDKFEKPIPGADLLLPNVYDVLMTNVSDLKDLGSGVIGGKECDHLAARGEEVDWQIWIAQGEHPYPCRYVITTKKVAQVPQYSVQIREWKTASEVVADDFGFKNATNANKVDAKELTDLDELPKHMMMGAAQ
jgi:hypothetical protein